MLKNIGSQDTEIGVYVNDGTYTAIVDASTATGIVRSFAQGRTRLEALENLCKKIRATADESTETE